VETFWNSRGQGRATLCLGQFQLSFPAQPGGYLAPSVTSAKAKGIPLGGVIEKWGGSRIVFEAIRELMAEPEPKSRRIGFKT